ncbi:hypothetical protein LOK49_LG03G03402 [Camellia lanceoleosa]|uniref:Uncharacterized protein n=1 Tax=Camellia lanceoleosa TaxID=1840588 RepID=A0ACC0IEE7_9ERIC|nr:hypothetical protein LOK49_LG03G03402 [Camellia lanceoleosa]
MERVFRFQNLRPFIDLSSFITTDKPTIQFLFSDLIDSISRYRKLDVIAGGGPELQAAIIIVYPPCKLQHTLLCLPQHTERERERERESVCIQIPEFASLYRSIFLHHHRQTDNPISLLRSYRFNFKAIAILGIRVFKNRTHFQNLSVLFNFWDLGITNKTKKSSNRACQWKHLCLSSWKDEKKQKNRKLLGG